MVKMPDGTKAKTKEDNVKVLGDHFEHEVHNRPEASSYMEGIEETIEQLPIEEAFYRLPDMEELYAKNHHTKSAL